MLRPILCLIAVGTVAGPSAATSYYQQSLPELVGRADAVVIGILTPRPGTGFDHRFTVSEVIAGTPPRSFIVLLMPDSSPIGSPGVVFLADDLSGPRMVSSRPRSVRALEEIRRLLLLKADPAAGLADPVTGNDPAFLELLGHTFARHDAVGPADRAAVAAHLRGRLVAADEATALAAVRALSDMGNTDSTAAVVGLLARPELAVRKAAVKYLGAGRDRQAVRPLCDLLDAETDEWLRSEIGGALRDIGDPAAAPALERAVRDGVDGWTCSALGRLGGRSGADALVGLIDRQGSTDAARALLGMVLRSNKASEEWMTDFGRRQDWADWWAGNRDTFEIVKPAEEALRKP